MTLAKKILFLKSMINHIKYNNLLQIVEDKVIFNFSQSYKLNKVGFVVYESYSLLINILACSL